MSQETKHYMSHAELAVRFKVSRRRIQQLEARALAKIRRAILLDADTLEFVRERINPDVKVEF